MTDKNNQNISNFQTHVDNRDENLIHTLEHGTVLSPAPTHCDNFNVIHESVEQYNKSLIPETYRNQSKYINFDDPRLNISPPYVA